ncbi:SHOCT domain-containing protein [Demequina sp. NBRC 110053]|uniref:SHOCT domain-containing protein n=1 Tax=Demequina sp. NBRC 110053 TaxID=1570342 RepID=UPI000A0570DF|nr:SHOCT domain-containing protein [Demequina sp. NBRC 110053]
MDNLGDVLWWMLWLFIWVTAVVIWFRCVWDLFSDASLGGWAKAGWVIFLVLVPWLSALIYVIVRGQGMARRSTRGGIVPERDVHADYMAGLQASAAPDPVGQVAKAKELLDAGAITQAEFEQLKAKALA